MEKIHNIVYKRTNNINNKIYIGVHATDNLRDGYMGSGKLFLKALEKYGKDNFSSEILYDVENFELASFIEELLVDEEFINREDTYNLQVGGKAGRQNIETRNKIGLKSKGRTPWNKGLIACYSPEVINNWSINRKGKRMPKLNKKVKCITIGKTYDSVLDASIETNISKNYICKCCLGNREFAGKLPDGTKLQWEYVK